MNQDKRFLAVAEGRMEADLVLKNASVFHSFIGRFIMADIAIVDGIIAGMGTYIGRRELDFEGKFITPGFIDTFTCIETALLSPGEFSRAIIPLGTTTVVVNAKKFYSTTDEQDFSLLLEHVKQVPLSVYFSLPQNVDAKQYNRFFAKFNGEKRVLRPKYQYTTFSPHRRKMVSDFTFFEKFNAYELQDEIERIMHTFQNGGAFFLQEKGIAICQEIMDSYTSQLCAFSTNGFSVSDFLSKGHVNHLVRTAVESGYTVETALQLATLYPARIWGLEKIGAIAPGFRADLLVFDDLKSWRPAYVFKDGIKIAGQRKALFCCSASLQFSQPAAQTIIEDYTGLEESKLKKDVFWNVKNTSGDVASILFAACKENKWRYALRSLKGCGLKKGVIAMIGTNRQLIAVSAGKNELFQAFQKLSGLASGIAIFENEDLAWHFPLPLMGLMSDQGMHYVEAQLEKARGIIGKMGFARPCEFILLLDFLRDKFSTWRGEAFGDENQGKFK